MTDDRRLPARHRADRLPDDEARAGLFSGSERRDVYEDEIDLRDVWATIRRRRRTIVATFLLVVASAALWTWLATPVWEASTLVRVADEKAGAPVLDVLASLQQGSELETEMRIISTRPILEDVVDTLDLNFVVDDPADMPRAVLFGEVEFGRDTPAGEYAIRRLGPGRYGITATGEDAPPLTAEFAPGDTVALPGGHFVLADLEAVEGERSGPVATDLSVETLGFQRAVDRLGEKLSVTRPDREANVVRVAYHSTDRILAYEVPNAVARSFIERRNQVQKTEARSTVQFLTEQSDQIRSQLEAAENELQAFRQERQIVALGAEAEAQVQRLAELRTERTRIDAERSALANLLDGIENETAEPDYRRIAAFPTFLKNQAIADLLEQLSIADRTRTELLVRLKPSHPDVVGIDRRIADLEEQLASIGRNYLNSLRDQVASLDAVLARFGSELEEIPEKEVQYARLERQRETLAELYKLLQTRLKEAQIAEAVEDPSVRVVESAILPIEPISPRPLRNLGLAGVLGLMLGLGLAFVREFMDTRLHSSDEIEVLFGLPTMARVPTLPLGRVNGDRTKALITLDGGQSAGGESFRNLRTNVRFVREGEGASEIVITSPGPQEGKSLTSANLAITLAQQGNRTLLIDADMRRPVQQAQFGVERVPGLSELLVGDEEPKNAVRKTELDNLFVLPAGKSPPNPAELLGSPRMARLLERLREMFECVVIDSPPALAVTDAAVLGAHTDGVILVVRAEKTHRDAITLAIRQLRQARADVLGIVVNDAKPEGMYYSYYTKYYGEETDSGLRGLLGRIGGR